MQQNTWLKFSFGYGLSYIIASVVCAILIIIGNDLLFHSAYRGNIVDSILLVNYAQWLPVCAVTLAISALIYLLFNKLVFKRLPVLLSAFICGLISVSIVLLTGTGHLSFEYQNWYEIKNIMIFFIAGFGFALFGRLLN